MADVGAQKEAADTKIRAYLEEEVKFPQTTFVILGGCHDNGYATTLRHLITEGYRDKLCLLAGYRDIEPSFKKLNLPIIRKDGLFELEKLAGQKELRTNPDQITRNGKGRQRSKSEPSSPTIPLGSFPPPQYIAPVETTVANFPIVWDLNALPRQPADDSTWSGALSTPFTDSFQEQILDCVEVLDSERCPSNQHAQSSKSSPEYTGNGFNSNVVPWKKLCAWHYLRGSCKQRQACGLEHDWLLSEEQCKQFAIMYKKLRPCRNGASCAFANDCLFGH
ncbi:hypothetical protein BC835DRAFT_1352256 [Cytidiella melzeri]|nr:hypothetical protein BC835DRAFT_1352256 [Cytidiella melzeri]